LIQHLAEHRIPLEVCPTSNIATRAVDVLENHPIRAMYDAGVLVTVNSDDPPMFGTTLNHEYEIAARLLDLDAAGMAGIAKNAVTASFMPGPDKVVLAAEIDAYVTAALR
jgi:aminodeoxyfutalosine deaminase